MSEPANKEVPAENKTASPSFMPVPTGHTLPAPSLAEVVRKNVERAGFPEVNETVMAAQAESGVAHIRAGTALPVDSKESKGDAHFLEDLTESKNRVLRLRTILDEAEESINKLRRQLAGLLPPL